VASSGDVRVAQPAHEAPLPRVRALEAFDSRPFRLLWLNTVSFSLIQGIQRFAFVWLVLDISKGSGAAGLVTFALGLPVFFFALPAGVLSDRMDRRVLLFGSQAAGVAVMALAAVLIWTDAISLGIAFALALAVGATTAFNQPVRQAILPSLVERDKLMNAIVMVTLGMNVTMILGPALGGLSIALWGIGGAFAAQAVLYGVGLLVLLPLRIPPVIARDGARQPMRDLREGFSFVIRHREIAMLMVLLVSSGMLMMGPSGPLIPQIAKEELGKEAFAASMLFAFVGVGMMTTSLFLAQARQMKNKGGVFTMALVTGGLVFAGIGLSENYALTAVFMFFWGMGGGIFINLNQTLIQSNTPHELMGRVMSIHTLGFMGMTPMGALLAGIMANQLGAPEWMAISGVILTIISMFIILTQPGLRRMA
jgi:MFS family permease